VGIAVVTGALGFIFARDLLRIMDASQQVISTGSGYTRAIYGGSGTVILLFLINGVFRRRRRLAGDARIVDRQLDKHHSESLAHLGLGPFPRLGVAASGIGTTIGRGCGVLLQLWFLRKCRVVVPWHKIRLIPSLMLRLVRLSLGGMFQYMIGMASRCVRERGHRRIYAGTADHHVRASAELGDGTTPRRP